MLYNYLSGKAKKKKLDSQALFPKNRCVQVAFYFYFIFQLGTFLDIWRFVFWLNKMVVVLPEVSKVQV